MSPQKTKFIKKKVGADGLTKQQRYLSKPDNYAKVLVKNRERMREKKKSRELDIGGSKSNERRTPTPNGVAERYKVFKLQVYFQATYADLTIESLQKTNVTDWRDLPNNVDICLKNLDDTLEKGRRLLRELSRTVDRHRVMWDDALDQMMGIYGLRKVIFSEKQLLRTEEDFRALDELSDDLRELEKLEEEELGEQEFDDIE